MKLRGTDFGCVLCASGAQGFFGEGYTHHRLLKTLGLLDFTGCTFVAKTTTLHARQGNMPMKKDGITPKELFPKCIEVDFIRGVMLNSVGLSGPGAEPLFKTGRWQSRTKPFFLSFMAVGKTPEERTAELREFVKLAQKYFRRFLAPVGLQINWSCPNVGLNPNELVDEAKAGIEIASALGVVLMPKFNIMVPIEAAKAISKHPACDALCISNTIPWGKLPEKIGWKKLFGSGVSPLAEFGGGGLSGRPLLPLVACWLREAKYAEISKPINAGGGILSPDDVRVLYLSGASSIFIGSTATLRPWRVRGIIRKAHQFFRKGDSQ